MSEVTVERTVGGTAHVVFTEDNKEVVKAKIMNNKVVRVREYEEGKITGTVYLKPEEILELAKILQENQ